MSRGTLKLRKACYFIRNIALYKEKKHKNCRRCYKVILFTGLLAAMETVMKHIFRYIIFILTCTEVFGIDFVDGYQASGIDNLNGNIIELLESSGKKEDLLQVKRRFVFTDSNKIQKEERYDEEGLLSTVISYGYSETETVLEIKGETIEGDLQWKYLYEYNCEDKLICERSFNSTLQQEWYDTYSYNETGYLIEKINYNADGTINLQNTYQYDDKNRLVLRLTLYSDGTLLKRVVTGYNENNQKDSEERYDVNGLYECVEYLYNDSGKKMKEKLLTADKNIKEIKTYNYNEQNLLEFESIKTPEQQDVSVHYEYDEKGNWIRKNDVSGLYHKREIFYK